MDLISAIYQQRQEALLLGDYDAYRAQCSRRLASLRKRLGVSNSKKKYQQPPPITAEDLARDPAYGNLLLVAAERAWAQAMHMKAQISDNPSSSTAEKRTHIVSRLAKAHKLAKEYSTLVSESSEDTLLLQSTAYAASLHGATQFELSHWESALRSFSLARIIFTLLHAVSKNDIYKDQLTSTADPSVRYAAYQLQLPRQLDIAAICREYFPRTNNDRLVTSIEKLDPHALQGEPDKSAGGAATVSSVTWRGRTAPVEEASISLALSAAQSSSSTPSPNFDEVLGYWQDAADAVRKRIDELISEGVGMSETRMQHLQLIFTYTSYTLISWRISRNRALIANIASATSGKKLTHLKEEVALYDAILQSLETVTDLPGVAADEEFAAEVAAKQAYFRALRAAAVAESHSLIGNKRNALAMYSLALRCIQSALSTPTTSPSPSEVETTTQDLKARVSKYRALVALDTLEKNVSAGQGVKGTVLEDLRVWRDSVDFENGVVELPPKVAPVPVKPVFLDCAWNFVKYPGSETRRKESVGEKEAEKKGLLGMFGWR